MPAIRLVTSRGYVSTRRVKSRRKYESFRALNPRTGRVATFWRRVGSQYVPVPTRRTPQRIRQKFAARGGAVEPQHRPEIPTEPRIIDYRQSRREPVAVETRTYFYAEGRKYPQDSDPRIARLRNGITGISIFYSWEFLGTRVLRGEHTLDSRLAELERALQYDFRDAYNFWEYEYYVLDLYSDGSSRQRKHARDRRN